jgi:hypothetical protein
VEDPLNAVASTASVCRPPHAGARGRGLRVRGREASLIPCVADQGGWQHSRMNSRIYPARVMSVEVPKTI